MKALQAKAGAGNVDIVHLLIDAGADVNTRGVEGGSALAAARNRGYEAIELILLGARTRLRTISKNVAGINTARGYSIPKDVSNISPQSSAITAPADISAIYSASSPLAQT